jgi:AraC-like DNA-binding protein
MLDPALRGALWGLLGLLALNLLRLRGRLPLEQLGLALALGLSVQVFVHAPAVEWSAPAWWKPPGVGIAMGNAVLGWLFARALCDDDFRLSWRQAALWAAMVLLGTLNLALLLPWCRAGGGPAWGLTLAQALFALPLVFGLLTVHAAATRWREDLVESRRGLRAFIVVGASLYTLGMVLLRRGTDDGRLTPALALVDAGTLLAIVAAVTWVFLRPVRDGLVPGLGPPVHDTGGAGPAVRSPPAVAASAATDGGPDPGVAHAAAAGGRDGRAEHPARAAPPPGPDGAPPAAEAAADRRLADALLQAMVGERRYKDPALSVASLARHLDVPEYRLRRHIHQRLGFRNFNAFVNSHRLAEARAALADPAQRHLPVLTLALEAGFGSIGPFNRAFKLATGLTPTDYRRQVLADS